MPKFMAQMLNITVALAFKEQTMKDLLGACILGAILGAMFALSI
jgi:hypothetical protein